MIIDSAIFGLVCGLSICSQQPAASMSHTVHASCQMHR